MPFIATTSMLKNLFKATFQTSLTVIVTDSNVFLKVKLCRQGGLAPCGGTGILSGIFWNNFVAQVSPMEKVVDEEEIVDGIGGNAQVADVLDDCVEQVGQVTADEGGQDGRVELKFGD